VCVGIQLLIVKLNDEESIVEERLLKKLKTMGLIPEDLDLTAASYISSDEEGDDEYY
jgi:hypothetical protein